jgi:hypothetical protein
VHQPLECAVTEGIRNANLVAAYVGLYILGDGADRPQQSRNGTSTQTKVEPTKGPMNRRSSLLAHGTATNIPVMGITTWTAGLLKQQQQRPTSKANQNSNVQC